MLVSPITSEPQVTPLPTISMAVLERDSISVEESERRILELITNHFRTKKCIFEILIKQRDIRSGYCHRVVYSIQKYL